MADSTGFDWPGYFHRLQDDEEHALAIWLAAEDLGVGEFMEIVERAYAAAGDHWHGRPRPFVERIGRPIAETHARRKRRFGQLTAMLEEARLSGALPGEVAAHELQLPVPPWMKQHRAEELLAALERAGRDQE